MNAEPHAVVSLLTPWAAGGGGYARTGQAYVDMIMWLNNDDIPDFFIEGNFLGTSLTQPLVGGRKYRMTLYVSLMDSMWYAGKNIGVHFSSGRPVQNNWSPEFTTAHLLSLVPQVRYEGDFLTDKEGWMEVSGSYNAQGGEDYITIGNFNGYHDSEVLFVDGGTPPSGLPHFYKGAYYFIDDVSVVEDRSIGIEESQGTRFSLHPNPASAAITIDAEHGTGIMLYDMAGRAVLHVALYSSEQTIGIGHLPSGLYIVSITTTDGMVLRKKLNKH